MITVRNTDARFGEPGPFAVESIDAFVTEMTPTFRVWAVEAYNAMASEDLPEDREIWIGEQIDEYSA